MHSFTRVACAAALAVVAMFAMPLCAFAEEQEPENGDLVPVSSDFLEADASAEEADEVETQEMYRLYNVRSGEHFYTASAEERDDLVAVGWFYEGVGWVAPVTSSVPVYRLYNGNAGDHHYTVSAEERDDLVAVGWNDEGIGWYSAEDESIPLYRQYNPNASAGAHNFTCSKDENDYLVGASWRDEGLAWYACGEGRQESMDWYSKLHLLGIVDAISAGGPVSQGYNTSIDEGRMARVNQCLNTDREVTFIAINTRTGKCISRFADTRFYGASTIKAPYIAALCKYAVPGLEALRNTMYEVITYSSNEGFNDLSARYGKFYEQAFANEALVDLDFKYGGTYVDLTPRELVKLWINIREFIISDGLYVDMFKGLFGNGGFFKEGWMWASFSGTVYHLAGIESDVVYAVMTRYDYRDRAVWDIKDAIVSAVE